MDFVSITKCDTSLDYQNENTAVSIGENCIIVTFVIAFQWPNQRKVDWKGKVAWYLRLGITLHIATTAAIGMWLLTTTVIFSSLLLSLALQEPSTVAACVGTVTEKVIYITRDSPWQNPKNSLMQQIMYLLPLQWAATGMFVQSIKTSFTPSTIH